MIRTHVANSPDVWQIEGVGGHCAVRVVVRNGWPIVEVADERDAADGWRWIRTDDAVLISTAIGAFILARLTQLDSPALADDEWARAAVRRGPGATTGLDPNPKPGRAICDGCSDAEIEIPLDGRDPDLWIVANGWSRDVDDTYCPACTQARASDPDHVIVGEDTEDDFDGDEATSN